MGFYEELALMVNSEIMRPEAAYYTFGVDAVEFWNEVRDWHNDPTWAYRRVLTITALHVLKIFKPFQSTFPFGRVISTG
jgi:hypothetical protein